MAYPREPVITTGHLTGAPIPVNMGSWESCPGLLTFALLYSPSLSDHSYHSPLRSLTATSIFFKFTLWHTFTIEKMFNELTSFLSKTKYLYFTLKTQKVSKFSWTFLSVFQKFDSVEDIIEHYKYFPIILIDGKDKTGIHREQCYLTQPLALNRHFSPW